MAKNHNSLSAHLLAILALPFMVIVVLPAAALAFSRQPRLWPWPLPLALATWIPGLCLMGLGGYLLAITIKLFSQVGRGTLAPWLPPQKLVVDGIYRHTRNPMISGVVCVLAGETLLTGAPELLAWTLGFFLLNHVYFIGWEEPRLAKRFGEAYLRYKAAVPRWWPRKTPWLQDTGGRA